MEPHQRAIFIFVLMCFFVSIYIVGEALNKALWRKTIMFYSLYFISSLSSQDIVTWIFADNDFLIVKKLETVPNILSKYRTPRQKRGAFYKCSHSYFLWTFQKLNFLSYFSTQWYSIIEMRYIMKAFYVNCFKNTWGKNLYFVYLCSVVIDFIVALTKACTLAGKEHAIAKTVKQGQSGQKRRVKKISW